MLDTCFKFECLKHSHGSYSEHTGFPNAGALPGATFLSGREAAAVLIGCARLPLGKLFSGVNALGQFLSSEMKMGFYCTMKCVLEDG